MNDAQAVVAAQAAKQEKAATAAKQRRVSRKAARASSPDPHIESQDRKQDKVDKKKINNAAKGRRKQDSIKRSHSLLHELPSYNVS